MKRACPELRLAALDGRRLPSEAHARACDACAAERESLARITDLFGDLEPPLPSVERVEEIRNALLGSAQASRPPAKRSEKWAISAVAVAALALLVATWVVARNVSPAREPMRRATVEPMAGARFVHSTADPKAEPARPELVRLAQGSIRLEVDPLKSGERFMVVTEDAEVEVRGTTFDVSAERERLVGVHVKSGTVEVRVRGAKPVILHAGSSWQRSDPEGAKAPNVSGTAGEAAPVQETFAQPDPVEAQRALPLRAKPERSRARGDRARPVETALAAPRASRSPANEQAFRDAWAAFARGDMEEAASLFADAERTAPGAALSEDASYGRAVALSRAGRRNEAIAEMERFLELHPNAARAGEVSVALGWLLLESGDLAEAKRRFLQALPSPVARVRRSAERGLEEIEDRSPTNGAP